MQTPVAFAVLFLTLAASAQAWMANGHHQLTQAAVRAAAPRMPRFFAHGERAVAHCSMDPDVVRNPATDLVRDAENPEHYIDYELLQGKPLPAARYAYVKLCAEQGVAPEKAGFLPYKVAESTERLAVALAEHRAWPKNRLIREKCLVYAGNLAHYAEDLCQPLHTTIHFDGRANPDNSSPGTGIHKKSDYLAEQLRLGTKALCTGLAPQPAEDLMPAVLAELDATRRLVDTVYAMESLFPASPADTLPMRLAALAAERSREAARFTAAMFLTAWKISERVKLPEWLDRRKQDR